MDPALDEPDSYYGTLAELVAYPDDFSYVIYRLRPAARWHDGKPVTPEDVIFSFETSKKLAAREPASITSISSRPRRSATTTSNSSSTAPAIANFR